MGCYGIGVNRIIAGLVETKHDENGIIWPLAVAPYAVILCPLNVDRPETMKAAETIYDQLQAAGVDVLLDDRDQRPGVKFKDADLIGIPLRVVVGGKGLKDGIVEVKWRSGRRTAEDSAQQRLPGDHGDAEGPASRGSGEGAGVSASNPWDAGITAGVSQLD